MLELFFPLCMPCTREKIDVRMWHFWMQRTLLSIKLWSLKLPNASSRAKWDSYFAIDRLKVSLKPIKAKASYTDWIWTYTINLWQEQIFNWIEVILLCLVHGTAEHSKNKNKKKYPLANSNCSIITFCHKNSNLQRFSHFS